MPKQTSSNGVVMCFHVTKEHPHEFDWLPSSIQLAYAHHPRDRTVLALLLHFIPYLMLQPTCVAVNNASKIRLTLCRFPHSSSPWFIVCFPPDYDRPLNRPNTHLPPRRALLSKYVVRLGVFNAAIPLQKSLEILRNCRQWRPDRLACSLPATWTMLLTPWLVIRALTFHCS